MDRIVNGKKYDTRTADFIESDKEDNPTRWVSLYRKKNGEFFSVHYTLWQGESDDLIPLDLEDAKLLAESLLDADGYETIFGKVEE